MNIEFELSFGRFAGSCHMGRAQARGGDEMNVASSNNFAVLPEWPEPPADPLSTAAESSGFDLRDAVSVMGRHLINVEINQHAVQQAGQKLSPHLFKLARQVK